MRATALVFAILGWLSATALAAPPPGRRVVLADPDPELRHAMEQALAPWHLEVVIEGPPPRDASMARERAEADTARFVVWRDGAALVVFDRELETLERRDSQAGVLDPPAAAAAALTIKTMMRLPPPPPPEAPPDAPAPAPPPTSIALRIQLAATGRLAHGNATDTSARFGGAVLVLPWQDRRWRFGVAGDTGTSLHPSAASFQGTWSEWVLVGVVGWGYQRERWEVEAHVGAGIRSSSLAGTEQGNDMRSESATLGTARVGASLCLRAARWTLGLTIDGDQTFNAPTYTKTTGNAVIYQVPDTGLEVGVVAGVDL